jgi:NAD+ synthase
MKFSATLPPIDLKNETEEIVSFIKDQVFKNYKRDGIVVGISGGIDSAVTAVLSLRAVGQNKLKALIMPEKESNPISAELGIQLAEKFNISYEVKELTDYLESYGAYRIRDDVIRKYFPAYDGSQKWKLVQPGNLLDKNTLNYYSIELESDGSSDKKRIKLPDLRAIIGATDVKQRTRMMTLYHTAETDNYIVAGTTNLSETEMGFFVKYGDGGVDIEPLAHLYKTYIFQLAEYLGVPEAIVKREPSPDTFSAAVSDSEFFFRLPYEKLDLFLWAIREDVPPEEVASTLNLSPDKVKQIFQDLKRKQQISAHLRHMPYSIDKVVP